MREREAFRDQLQSLREQFAGQEVLTLDQSSKLLGLDRAALLGDKDFPAKKVGKKYIIPIVPLARWMATWGFDITTKEDERQWHRNTRIFTKGVEKRHF